MEPIFEANLTNVYDWPGGRLYLYQSDDYIRLGLYSGSTRAEIDTNIDSIRRAKEALEKFLQSSTDSQTTEKEDVKINRPNVRRLKTGEYLVRTQAGYRKAIRNYFKEIHETSDFELSHLTDYPKAYPAICRFGFHYVGFHQPIVKIVGLNDYVSGLQDLLNDIKED